MINNKEIVVYCEIEVRFISFEPLQVNDYKSKYSAEQEKVTLKQRELEAAKEEVPSARKIAELDSMEEFGNF